VDERERLRTTFDQAAELYQDARPDYPPELFDRLIDLAGLHLGDSVLEVGAGPGKATLPLAQRGLHITALEPGPALAAHARRNLTGYPVEVVEARFEDWAGPPAAFAAVVAATAWHWVDPDRRYERAADALRPGGHLAIWTAQHVFPVDGDPFFAELQEVYDGLGEAPPDGVSQPAPGELEEQTAEIEASGLFDVVAVQHLDWTVDYTAEAYVDLLRTFSGHIAMAPLDREHLFSEIRRRIARRPSGTVRRGWGTVLHVARKR
jgi:SAM-dependent methyltransferase